MDAPEDLLKEIREMLGAELLGKSGSVLYSSRQTLKPGKAYFLGAHPGGNPNDPVFPTVKQDIEECLQRDDASFSKFTDEDWGHGLGGHLIQQSALMLFHHLGIELRDTCSSNVSFFRQLEDREWDGNADSCWQCHLAILACVQPRFIIAYNAKSRDYLLGRLTSVEEDAPSFQLPPNKSLQCFTGEIRGAGIPPVCLLAIPCLSRPWIGMPRTKEALDWLKQKMEEHG